MQEGAKWVVKGREGNREGHWQAERGKSGRADRSQLSQLLTRRPWTPKQAVAFPLPLVLVIVPVLVPVLVLLQV